MEDIALVADVPLNLLFRCRGGHSHELVEGDRANRTPIQPGEIFYLPRDCALGLFEQFGPKPDNANVSGAARDRGLIAGLRLA
jgi:hypothetical protein